MSIPVLATKLFAPSRRPQLVARPRLTTQLDATLNAGHRLTLVSAPAGFGKTTVLSDWLAHLAEGYPHVRAAWLSLDEGDNDLLRLMAHLVAGLQDAGLGGDAVLESLRTTSIDAALTVLVNDLTGAAEHTPGERWVVVLDDYHVIATSEVHEAMTFLLDHLPDELHLVMSTRFDPPLPLARLRARGQLVEVRAAHLRFTAPEALAFLTTTMGLELRPADAQALGERTEGWIAGLQLAAVSLRDIADPSEVAGFIEAFAGSNRFVLDYLADEVLARQPKPIREFLLGTAMLDRLSGPLCDAVTGGVDGDRMLADLERDNLFIVPLDAQQCWYRYHHLFADVLRVRLRAASPDLLPRGHRRASEWFATHGHVEDAVRHALAANAVDRAADLMEEALPDLRRARRDGLLLRWARALPDEEIRARPVLGILSAWSLMMSGHLDAAERRLDDADVALARGAKDEDLVATWADTEDLRTAPATVAIYRASLAQARGDVAGTARHARRALELSGPDDHFVRGAGSGFVGLAAWAEGDVETALATFTEATRRLHAAGNLVDELDGTVVLADLWLVAGHPSRARHLCEQGLRTATGGGIPYSRAAADLHVALAELDLGRDDLVSAATHLESARVLAERTSITENRHRWFVAMARLRAARGDAESAYALFDQAEALYRPGFYPDVRPIAAMRARVQIAAGDLASAAEWAEAQDLDADAEPDYLREYDVLTVVRLQLAQAQAPARGGGGRGGDRPAVVWPVGDVLALLDRWLPAAADQRREGSVREIRMLQSLARSPRLPQPLTGDLSPREVEVLRLLGSELTGPEIARALYITLNTLRTHTKHIFTKLDATTRAAAVRRARERGLL